jgi:hypothetical protein
MASTYSANLGIELIGTGDQSGTWGATTNTNFGTLVEQAIVGYSTQAVTDSGVATVLLISNGASSTGRNYVITLTGALTAARTVEVPAVNKPYIFFNSTTGGFAVTVKVTGQTGVIIANGKKAIVYTNTTDVIEVANAPATEAGTQTLTNKTLTAPVIATIVNTGTLTLPTSTDTLVGRATTDTLTNKTLTSPIIATIVNTGTLTLPTSTDTLVGRATTDTLTNKTLTSPLIGTVIGGTSASSSLTLQSTSGVGTSDSILFKVGNNGATTAMTVDTSGNVGIGTSSPSQRLDVRGSIYVQRDTNPTNSVAVQLTNQTTVSNNGCRLSFDAYNIGTSGLGVPTDSASLAFYTNGITSERMRIDSSGNVGIGTSTFNGVKTVVQGSQTGGAPQTSGTTQTYGLLRLRGTSFTSSLDFGTNGGDYAWIQSTDTSNLATNYDLALQPNGGNLLVGTTATFSSQKMVVAAANDSQLALNATTSGSSVYTTLSFANQGTVKTQAYWESTQSRFYIANGGGGVYLTTAATAWTAASDERVKNIIEPITDAAAKVNQLRAVIGSYKSDESNKRKSFLIAQDVLAVLPEAVDTSNPDEFGLAYTDVIPLLVAAIQELSAKNDALEARLAKLETVQ